MRKVAYESGAFLYELLVIIDTIIFDAAYYLAFVAFFIIIMNQIFIRV